MNTEQLMKFITTTGYALAIKVAACVAFWIVGRWIIRHVVAVVHAGMNRNSVDPTLMKYLGSILSIALNVVLVIGILGYAGIQTTSFAALLAGAGVAIGAAWGGLLAHFAAGAFLLVLRPFKVGDLISAGGTTGAVREIGLFGTTIVTADNVVTVVANNRIFSDNILNYSSNPVRRVERTALVAAGVDPSDAIERLRAAVVSIPFVAADPAPEVEILDFVLEGTVIAVRTYTHTDNYWSVYFAMNRAIASVGAAAHWPAPSRALQVAYSPIAA